jgi:hypothetical protein
MNAQEILAQIDHAMTEVDLVLWQWQTDLDMMSFIGQEIPLKLWTNDDPPVVVTLANMENTLKKPVRVMHHVNGEWTQVGTAEVTSDGRILANIDTDAVPELKPPKMSFSIAEPLAHFEVGSDGKWKQNFPIDDFDPAFLYSKPQMKYPPFENEAAAKLIENHPFFKKEQ